MTELKLSYILRQSKEFTDTSATCIYDNTLHSCAYPSHLVDAKQSGWPSSSESDQKRLDHV